MLTPPFDVMAIEKGYPSLPFAERNGLLVSGAATSKKFLTQRPDVAKRFLHATWRGLRAFKTDKNAAVQAMVKYMKLGPDMAASIYDNVMPRYSDTGYGTPDFLKEVLNVEFGKYDPLMEKRAFDFSIVKGFNPG